MHDFSLIVPTRNRHSYLTKTVQAILDSVDGIELIISDNSDQQLRHDFKVGNSVLKYIYSSDLLSVIDNFERALELSTRKYVSIIGDDDLISNKLPVILKKISEDRIDSIFPWNEGYIAHFLWPGVKEESGQLWLRDYDWSISSISPSKAIDDSVKFPGKGPANLPKLYQGIVSQDVIRETRRKNGHIFGGVSPDIYSGILLAERSKNIASINYPFIIPGASMSSTAGEGALRSDRDKRKSNKEHIARFGASLKWPSYIPDVYTSHTVWALSLYAASKQLGVDLNKSHIFFLYFEMLARYPEYSSEILRCMKSKDHLLQFPVKVYLGLESVAKYYLPRILNKSFRRRKLARKISFKDISEIQSYVGS